MQIPIPIPIHGAGRPLLKQIRLTAGRSRNAERRVEGSSRTPTRSPDCAVCRSLSDLGQARRHEPHDERLRLSLMILQQCIDAHAAGLET
jgi:hypothetical protein